MVVVHADGEVVAGPATSGQILLPERRVLVAEQGPGHCRAVLFDHQLTELARLELTGADRIACRVIADQVACADDRGRVCILDLEHGRLIAEHRIAWPAAPAERSRRVSREAERTAKALAPSAPA